MTQVTRVTVLRIPTCLSQMYRDFHLCFVNYYSVFYIHGSVQRDSILIRFNKMQQYAGVFIYNN